MRHLKNKLKTINRTSRLFLILLIFLIILTLYYIHLPVKTPFESTGQYYETLKKFSTTTRPAQPDNSNKDDLSNLIPLLKEGKYQTVDVIALLKDKAEICSSVSPCIQIDNATDSWKVDTSDGPVINSISRPFAIRLAIKTNSRLSGIHLIGRRPPKGTLWWVDIVYLFVGTNANGSRIFVSENHGESEYNTTILDQRLERPSNTIYIVFDREGKNYIVLDEFFNIIVRQDINKVTKNKFPNGLIPNKNLFVGFSVGPKSNLVITDLSVLTF